MTTPIVLRFVTVLMTLLCVSGPVQAVEEQSEIEKRLNKLLVEIHTKGAIETDMLEELKRLVTELEQEGAGELPELKELKRLLDLASGGEKK